MEYKINTIDQKSFVITTNDSIDILKEDMLSDDVIFIWDLCTFKCNRTNNCDTNTIIVPSRNITSVEYYK